ncbi:MAG: TolC family protein [Candidatus Sphingomonas phytovorans]|nr:TolC family protein [Sphingomonas sp.]WEK00952.1 MAG: TolC family protein [Sphingomonas sp.]
MAQAEAGLREARTQLEIGVTKAWGETEAARRRFLLLDSALVSAEENLRLQTLSYREQQTTSLDVIDAQLGPRPGPHTARPGGQ